MSSTLPRVVVLGGGIRGTAIAALLAQSRCCEITLLEKDAIGSGASATNHGRLHSGTSLWQGDEHVRLRHQLGGRLIQDLTNAIEPQQRGLYIVEASEDVELFEQSCQRCALPYQRIDPSNIGETLNADYEFSAVYEVPEYCFSPAHLAGKFAYYAASLGASVHTYTCVRAIGEHTSQVLRLDLATGGYLDADMVINTAGMRVNSIHTELQLARPQIELNQWKILCLNLADKCNPAQMRAITILENDNLPSGLPHGHWLVFGCRVPIKVFFSPEEASAQPWQPFNPEEETDNILFGVHAGYFRYLQDLTQSEIEERLFTFSGVYTRFAHRQEHPFQIFSTREVPNYYVVGGDLATTALLDAADTVQTVMPRLTSQSEEPASYVRRLVEQLSKDFTSSTYSDTATMIWEQHEQKKLGRHFSLG